MITWCLSYPSLYVTNMSRCAKYQAPREGVGVVFGHGVKMRQKHLGLFDYPGTHQPTTSHQQTRILSRTTHTSGDPLSSKDFSDLTKSPSPRADLFTTLAPRRYQ